MYYSSRGNILKDTMFLIFLCCGFHTAVGGLYTYTVNKQASFDQPLLVQLPNESHIRVRRQGVQPPSAVPEASTPLVSTTPIPTPGAPVNHPDDSNKTVNVTMTANVTTSAVSEASTVPVAAVTQIPLLGRNGTGILNVPTVSEPILPGDDNLTDVFSETPDRIKAEHNIANLTYDQHNFYNSTFIGNLTYFNEHWNNITREEASVHRVLSNSHRRATTLQLSFDFPFYGHDLRNITVATGGFIYTGEHVHNWLAATQYIAPLMANFDTTLTNDSYVKMHDDGEKFSVFWENVTLQEDKSKRFTFAVTLYKNGDIVFAYKTIPISVQNINDVEHPVKVGISDAYLTDRILFLIRRKTIYEYDRVSFKNYEISNNTLLKLTALPTCLQYDTCDTCVNHNTGFDGFGCMWCEAIHKCSSGKDRNKQDWVLRNCDKAPISNTASCPAGAQPHPAVHPDSTAYTTDDQARPAQDVTINTQKATSIEHTAGSVSDAASAHVGVAQAHSPVGGVVGAFVAITLVCSAAAWVLYAFKNPHTRSGQMLIKYRPSQWSWRRGEARYTAATIHM